MRKISQNAGLSKVYTNHCLRATCITILDGEGFATRDICHVSGHANEGSLAGYVGKVKDSRKQDMSDAISRSLGYNDKPTVAPATVSRPTVAPAATVSRPSSDDRVREPHHDEVDNDEIMDLDLELTSSQMALIEEMTSSIEEMTSSIEEMTSSIEEMMPSSQSSQSSVISTTTTRRTMVQQNLQQQLSFVLKDCNVTINYVCNNY